MKVIYHCFGGSHSSVICAALHLGILDKGRVPSLEELLRLPYFDKTGAYDFGNFRFMGIDKMGNEIYVLGKKSLADRYTLLITGIADILGVKNEIMALDTNCKVNWIMKIGGFLSRRVGLVSLGRFLLGIGIKKAFPELVLLVEKTEKEIAKAEKEGAN